MAGEETAIIDILRLGRYTAPTQEEAINHIREYAEMWKTDRKGLRKRADSFLPGGLQAIGATAIFRDLPEKVIGNIISEEQETIDHLRGHFRRDQCEGRQYVRIDQAKASVKILEREAQKIVRKKGVALYDTTIQMSPTHHQGKILLNEDGTLPNWDLLYEEIREEDFPVDYLSTIKNSYNVLNSPGALDALEDISQTESLHEATMSLLKFSRCPLTKSSGSLIEIIEIAIPTSFFAETQREE
jgi:hypothetical protein